MKKLINLKGAKYLATSDQKEITGGLRPIIQCNGNCNGRPTGSQCFYQGHCGCEGRCSSGECIPY